MKIVIAGGSGFIGKHLIQFLEEKGHELIALSRSSKEGCVLWNPEKAELDLSLLEGCDVVINLCGENILGRWNKAKKAAIKESRIQATQFLCDSLLRLKKLPRVYLGASATGYYGDRGDEVLTEKSAACSTYLAEVCTSWEKIPDVLYKEGVRVALLRLGIVLGSNGGALEKMEKPFRKGMGGILGSGKQWMSWIGLSDLLRAIEHVIENDTCKGPINMVAPSSVTNLEFTTILSTLFGKSAPLPISKFILGMLFGSGAEIFLSSARVHPEKLLQSGFVFEDLDLESTLKKYLLIKS